jgi:ABC-2 type transport system ATP-binding protein
VAGDHSPDHGQRRRQHDRLLTTHYLDEADRLADRIAIVDNGRVVAEGDPDQLKRGLAVPSLDEVYLRYAGRRSSDATRLTEVSGR